MDFFNDMLTYSYSRSFVELFLMVVGIAWILKNIVWNIMFILLFCYSYSTLCLIRVFDELLSKESNYIKLFKNIKIFQILKTFLFKWPFECFLNYCFEDVIDSISIGRYILYPPCIFKKRKWKKLQINVSRANISTEHVIIKNQNLDIQNMITGALNTVKKHLMQ